MTCKWIYNECHDYGEDYWETECGEGHYFTSGGPDENKYKYCPYCGKEIEVNKHETNPIGWLL